MRELVFLLIFSKLLWAGNILSPDGIFSLPQGDDEAVVNYEILIPGNYTFMAFTKEGIGVPVQPKAIKSKYVEEKRNLYSVVINRSTQELKVFEAGKAIDILKIVDVRDFLAHIDDLFSPPVLGKWWVQQGPFGETHRLNHAIDLVKVDDFGRRYSGDGKALTDWFSFGEKVLSPVDGKVIYVKTGNKDNPVGHRVGLSNEIHIESKHIRYIFSHLKAGSISLAVGENVKVGEVIGAVGNSGKSLIPHLHIASYSSNGVSLPLFIKDGASNTYIKEGVSYTFHKKPSGGSHRGRTEIAPLIIDNSKK